MQPSTSEVHCPKRVASCDIQKPGLKELYGKLSISLLLTIESSIYNKLHALKVFVEMYKPDILAVTESWGRPCLLDSLLKQEGYALFR